MLSFGLQVTALGFGLVLVILVALMFVMQGMSNALIPKPKKEEPKQEIKAQEQPPASVAVAPVVKEDDDEILAVIAAATAACGHQVVIKAITRVIGTNTAPWSATGRTEAMNLRQL